MKINLTKEHIKKGCELVDCYHISEFSNRFVWNRHKPDPTESSEGCDVLANEVFYRDFLQLVIEGINRDCSDIGIRVISKGSLQLNWNKNRNGLYFKHADYESITQAKEALITYACDNLLV